MNELEPKPNKKIALCFIISYKHLLNKEHIWREWIEPNKDIINVYFHYKNFSQIQSPWIRQFAIPTEYIAKTSYFHVVPAYMNLIKFALIHDTNNQWFCFLTDSCVPIIPPLQFRQTFIQHQHFSIMKWKPSWWNIDFNKRANLRLLQKEYHLANDPWFILKREDALVCIKYSIVNNKIFNSICSGIIANESVFAIILTVFGQCSSSNVINETTHITDWENMSSSTSPYIFKNGDKREMDFILKSLQKNKYNMFLRKVDYRFPDAILSYFLSTTLL